ncbi:MAG TPA: phosphoribosyltransferase [Ferruginibacter sp.]|nr:phosphoribosyltransferase [Ferruginibacter sp.]HPH90072.1 phosphoribosyltransferase [Ferruginibacter sp.]
METKPWGDIEHRINEMPFEETFDMIVAIANGGIIPAALLQQKLKIPVELLKISFRDTTHKPLYDTPQLVAPLHFDVVGKKILLVEDRVKTGATLEYARQLLKSAALVKTFAVNGKADYPLFDENCFSFPWILK